MSARRRSTQSRLSLDAIATLFRMRDVFFPDGMRGIGAAIGGFLTATSPVFAYWALGGLETSIQALLLLSYAAGVIRFHSRRSLQTAACVGVVACFIIAARGALTWVSTSSSRFGRSASTTGFNSADVRPEVRKKSAASSASTLAFSRTSVLFAYPCTRERPRGHPRELRVREPATRVIRFRRAGPTARRDTNVVEPAESAGYLRQT